MLEGVLIWMLLSASFFPEAESAAGDVVSYMFTSTLACSDVYGSVLSQRIVRSLLECLKLAGETSGYQSVTFNTETNYCSVNDNFMCVVSTSCATPNIRYIERKIKPQILDPCTGDGDCPLSNSHCRDAVCKCRPGYSWNPSTCGCVESCSTYGTTFQEHVGHGLAGNNVEIISGLSIEECKAECIGRTDFTCTNIDYKWGYGFCCLQVNTCLTHPDHCFEDTNYSAFMRDCA